MAAVLRYDFALDVRRPSDTVILAAGAHPLGLMSHSQ
jgi:hypothetical protein